MWKHVYLCCYQSCKLRHQSFFNDVCASFINGLTPVFHQSTGTGLHCVSWWLLNVSELLIIEGTGEINKTAFLIDLIAALSIFCETMCILSTIGYKTHKQYHRFISLKHWKCMYHSRANMSDKKSNSSFLICFLHTYLSNVKYKTVFRNI